MPLTSTDGLVLSVTVDSQGQSKKGKKKSSSIQSKIRPDVMKDFKVLQLDGGGDESDSEECSKTKVAAGDSLSDEIVLSQNENSHDLTISDIQDDGSLQLREEGALTKERSHDDSIDNSLPRLNSSILLSDKIGLSISEIEEDEDNMLDEIVCDEGRLQYGIEDTALEESLDAELAEVGRNLVSEGDDHVKEMQVSHLKEFFDDSLQAGEVNRGYVSDSSQESYDNIGLQLLRQLDRDFLSSPRLIVRGVWRGDNLELVANRRLEGNLVHWTLTYIPKNKIVMLCKARMDYKYSLPDTGIAHHFKLRGGLGWGGLGYGFINLFPSTDSTSYAATAANSDSKPKHVNLKEAVFFGEGRHYHVSGEGCKNDSEVCTQKDCGVRIWGLVLETFHCDRSDKRGLNDEELLVKLGHDQTLLLSLVAYHSGEQKIIIHRDRKIPQWGGKAITKNTSVASLSRTEVHFDDGPQIDHLLLNKHLNIRTAQKSPICAEAGEGQSSPVGEGEMGGDFDPPSTSTPQKKTHRRICHHRLHNQRMATMTNSLVLM